MFKRMILDKLERIEDLPTLLTITLEVEKLVNDPKTSVEQIEYLSVSMVPCSAVVLVVTNLRVL